MFQLADIIQPITQELLAAFFAVCVGLCMVPLAKKWGRRFGLVDQPDKKRKLHANAVPLIGGIAIFLTVLITLLILTAIDKDLSLAAFLDDRSLRGLFFAGIVILCVGIIDDRVNIRGRQKLLGQFVAAAILISFGFKFDIISVFGMDFIGASPIFYGAVAFAWILIGINSVNLLDGADGFASTIGAVTCIALCVMTTALASKIEPPEAGKSIADYRQRLQLESDSPLQRAELNEEAKELQKADYVEAFMASEEQPSQKQAEEQAEALQNQQILRAEHLRDAIICAIMAGAILAFLRFNFPPATAFLGDAGSMLIGLFIAAMAIKTGAKQATGYVFIAPIALLAIPLFDTLAAIVRRKLTGRSIYDTDRGHLHHVLIGKGFGPRKSLLLFFAMCLMTATGGTMALIEGKAAYAYLAILSVAIFLFVGRIFGLAEFKLISHGSSSIIRAVLPSSSGGENKSNHTSFRIQGTRDWEICWQVMREFAEDNLISQLSFDLNLPWIHESFHGKYKSSNKELLEDQWALELPILIEERVIGRVNLQAPVRQANYESISQKLCAVLQSLEPQIVLTMQEHKAKRDDEIDEFLAEQQSIEFGGVTAETKDVGRN